MTQWLTNKENPASELLEFGLNHNMTLPEGLQDVADTLAPKFVGTCAILFTFSFLVSVVLRRHSQGQVMIDWVRSKPVVAAAGLMTPVMATVTSFGLILWCGQLYNAIVNVSPFLILCIGIDDLFIMSAEWHRTNPKHSAERRIGQTLSEAAVAISITSVTDIVSGSLLHETESVSRQHSQSAAGQHSLEFRCFACTLVSSASSATSIRYVFAMASAEEYSHSDHLPRTCSRLCG